MTDAHIASHFGFDVGTVRRLLNRWYDRLPRSVVDDAVAKAISASAHSWNYVEVILKSKEPVQMVQELDNGRVSGRKKYEVVEDDKWASVMSELAIEMSNRGDYELMVVGAVGMRLHEYAVVVEVRNGLVKEWWRSRILGLVERVSGRVYGAEIKVLLQSAAEAGESSVSGSRQPNRVRRGRACAHCGEPLDAGKRLGSKYCDVRCRNNALNQRKRGGR